MTVTASSPKFRYRRGPADFVTIPTPASTAIQPGDLVWNNSGTAAVASAFTWDTSLAVTQAAFRQKFLGVSCDQKLATDTSTRPIAVQTKGVFSYDCAALGAAHHIGEYVGPAKDAAGNNLLDQTLAIAATVTLGIGSIAHEAASGATSLEVYLQSFQMFTGQSVSS